MEQQPQQLLSGRVSVQQVTSEIVSGQLIWTDIYLQFLLTLRLGDLELKAKLAESRSQQREGFLGRKAGLSFPRLQLSWGA